jgi:hypothetical protein
VEWVVFCKNIKNVNELDRMNQESSNPEMGITMKHFRGYQKIMTSLRWGFILIPVALAAIFCIPATIQSFENELPFSPGEKLTFQVRWAFIPAGEAILEVFPVETVNAISSYHFVMTARTYEHIDFFYMVRDRIDSYTDEDMTHSILYKKVKKGKSRKRVVVNFDWKKQEVQYSNFGAKMDPVSILPGSFDPLSVFYAFRLDELKENTVIKAPVTDGKKSVIGKARVIKREKITVPSGVYETYLVEPDLEQLGGVFKKSKNAKLQIWVTADKKHIPVKVKSKVIVGSFVAELIRIEGIDTKLNLN